MKNARGWVFAIVSCGLHLVWVFALRELPLEAPRRETEVEFSLVTQPTQPPTAAPEPPPTEPPPTAAAEAEPATRRRAEPRRAAPKPAQRVAAAAAEAVPVEAPAPAEAPSQAPAPSPARPPVLPDLSPRRAAVASYDTLTKPPSSCNPPAADGGACLPPARDELAQDRLNQSLRQSVRSLAHLAPREPPVLHREADGGYRFDGHVFTAKIEPDGHVRFADGAVASIDGPATSGPGVRGSFDLNDALERMAGSGEAYSAEKRWFLDQTEELRAQLANAARARERAAGRRHLERELERILAAHEQDPALKRARVFALWQDCGDDADSADARQIVEVFVRMHMPAGSALGFSPQELARLNAARRGMRQFDPYRSPIAGSPG